MACSQRNKLLRWILRKLVLTSLRIGTYQIKIGTYQFVNRYLPIDESAAANYEIGRHQLWSWPPPIVKLAATNCEVGRHQLWSWPPPIMKLVLTNYKVGDHQIKIGDHQFMCWWSPMKGSTVMERCVLPRTITLVSLHNRKKRRNYLRIYNKKLSLFILNSIPVKKKK